MKDVRDKLRQHPRLFYAAGGVVAIAIVEVGMLRQGAPPLAMVMAVIIGIPAYWLTIFVGLRTKRGDDREDG